MSYRKLEESGIMLPVSEFHVNYLLPAKYDDELTITTRISSLRGARITFDYEISNDAGKLVSKASTTLVFVQRSTMRPTSPPDEFLKILEPHLTNHE
jgi:acyl-CoA thioester hydrolase